MTRSTLATLVGIVAVIPLYFWCFMPWQCNRTTKLMEAALQAGLRGNPGARAFLRDNVEAAEACRARIPDDANLNVAIASTYAMFDRYEEALRVYEDAFRYDRRPEMYFNRAGIRLRLGDREGAYDDFSRAVHFNPRLVERINDTTIKARLEEEVGPIRQRRRR